jgi:hypothetical protein
MVQPLMPVCTTLLSAMLGRGLHLSTFRLNVSTFCWIH